MKVTVESGDWWQRYTYVGVDKEFPATKDAAEIAMRGTADALKSIRPDACELIDRADNAVRKHGADLRFLIRAKSYKKYTLKVATTIATHPDSSLLYVSLTDRHSGEIFEAEPIFCFYQTAFHDAMAIGIRDIEVGLSSNGERKANWSNDIQRAAPSVVQDAKRVSDPFYSKLVLRQ